jgi:hypothetical protein
LTGGTSTTTSGHLAAALYDPAAAAAAASFGRAMLALENEMMALLDYGGISTNDAESAIKRASKGGMVGAKQLRGLVATLAGGFHDNVLLILLIM